MRSDNQTVSLTFANYNYAFSAFYEHYKNLCLKISENTELINLNQTRKIITTFIYENEYTLNDRKKRSSYRNRLMKLKQRADNDLELKATLTKDLDYTVNKIKYRRKYYEYFLKYLIILGEFVSELTTTYMPNTNIQRKLLRYTNNQMFFEKFTSHKDNVVESLADFEIKNFTVSFNKLVTFFFAYSLFVNDDDTAVINDMFSYALTLYLSKENLVLIAKEGPTYEQRIQSSRNENILHKALLFCLSLMNQSFSNYDVLPKLRDKIYIDQTLI